MKRALASSFVAMFVIFGTTSCSTLGIPDSSTWSQPDKTVTAALAKDKLDAFFVQVKADTTPYMLNLQLAGGANATNETKKVIFADAFQKSLSYTDAEVLPEAAAFELISAYAKIFILFPDATFSSQASDFSVSGSTASIEGDRFTVTIKDVQLPKSKADLNSHRITLHMIEGGTWLISGYGLASAK